MMRSIQQEGHRLVTNAKIFLFIKLLKRYFKKLGNKVYLE